MQKRRRFSKEFKREAVQMTRGADMSITQVAADLGLHANVLSRWCREQTQEGITAFRGQGVPRDEELVRLKRELARVKRERDFLKDAAAFFAKDARRDRP
ncbi:MAG: transposase [Nitrospirales bacterium]|nr:transposase [Nitrospirales bacterium]